MMAIKFGNVDAINILVDHGVMITDLDETSQEIGVQAIGLSADYLENVTQPAGNCYVEKMSDISEDNSYS